MNALDRDKIRLHTMLKAKRGEAFSVQEISETTGMDAHRVASAGAALVISGHVKVEEGYFWVVKTY